MQRSEVQRVLAEIDAAAMAAHLGLYGLAQVDGHAFLLARQKHIAESYGEQLKNLYYSLHPEEKKVPTPELDGQQWAQFPEGAK